MQIAIKRITGVLYKDFWNGFYGKCFTIPQVIIAEEKNILNKDFP